MRFARKGTGFHETRLRIEFGQSMTGTGRQLEELGTTPQKVKNLGHEKQEQGLGKMSQNAHDRKGHAGKVTISIADKDRCGIKIVSQ